MPNSNGILGVALSNVSVVDRVFDVILTAILNGELKPGNQLPTEQELCQNLNVGRNSVREAIKRLEAYGIVYIKRSEGTFVSEGYSEKMLDPMLYGMILQENGWNDFMDLERVIDIGTMHLLLNRADTEKLAEQLNEILDQMDREIRKTPPSIEKIAEIDTEFHAAIAKSLGNVMVESISRYVSNITKPSREETVEKILEQNEREDYLKIHRKIAEVIRRKASEEIEEAVLEHYKYWKEPTQTDSR